MNRVQRPHWKVKKDANHDCVLDAFKYKAGGFHRNEFKVWRGYVRGYHVELHDTAGPGGELLDWIVIIEDIVIFVEVKAEREVKDQSRQRLSDLEYYRGELKSGEESFLANTHAHRIITYSSDHFWQYVEKVVEYIETRDSVIGRFTLPVLMERNNV